MIVVEVIILVVNCYLIINNNGIEDYYYPTKVVDLQVLIYVYVNKNNENY